MTAVSADLQTAVLFWNALALMLLSSSPITLTSDMKDWCGRLTACACLIKSKMSSLRAWWILAGPLSSHRHTA